MRRRESLVLYKTFNTLWVQVKACGLQERGRVGRQISQKVREQDCRHSAHQEDTQVWTVYSRYTVLTSVADPDTDSDLHHLGNLVSDPHQSESLVRIRICIKVKSRIRIRIRVKRWKLRGSVLGTGEAKSGKK
jgi:hypothetical protein